MHYGLYAVRPTGHLAAIATALAVLVASVPCSGAPAKDTTLDELLRVQASVQENYERVRLALVAIQCNGGTASGVIVSPTGLVLTAAHVVETAGHKAKVTIH